MLVYFSDFLPKISLLMSWKIPRGLRSQDYVFQLKITLTVELRRTALRRTSTILFQIFPGIEAAPTKALSITLCCCLVAILWPGHPSTADPNNWPATREPPFLATCGPVDGSTHSRTLPTSLSGTLQFHRNRTLRPHPPYPLVFQRWLLVGTGFVFVFRRPRRVVLQSLVGGSRSAAKWW